MAALSSYQIPRSTDSESQAVWVVWPSLLNNEKDKGGNGNGRERRREKGAVKKRVEGMVSEGCSHSRHQLTLLCPCLFLMQ